jgi:hypothetical protein
VDTNFFDVVTCAVVDHRQRDSGCCDLAGRIVMFRRRRARDRDRDGMPAWIAFVNMCSVVVSVRRDGVFVIGEAVVMSPMIVIAIGVNVQRGHAPRSGDQNEDEQGRDPAGHVWSL